MVDLGLKKILPREFAEGSIRPRVPEVQCLRGARRQVGIFGGVVGLIRTSLASRNSFQVALSASVAHHDSPSSADMDCIGSTCMVDGGEEEMRGHTEHSPCQLSRAQIRRAGSTSEVASTSEWVMTFTPGICRQFLQVARQ